MKIKIIQIGKNSGHYIEEGLLEFLKRLKPFVMVEFFTLKEITSSKTFPKEKAIEKEGEEILKIIGNMSKNENPYVVALDEKGKELTSVEFAKFLERFSSEGRPVVFIIGGPYGLSGIVKQRADSLFAMSRMTFTHQMIRLFLLEQIYRGVSILKGKEYHHE